METIALATGNKNKIAEFKYLLKDKDYKIEQIKTSLIEIQTLDILKIADHKLDQAIGQCPKEYNWVIIDDTSLEIEALNGLPGPFIKWFLTSINANGIFELIKEKSKVTRAICVIGIGEIKTGKKYMFKGELLGTIEKPKESDCFGWDGLFKPLRSSKTFAEMTIEEKNRFSHRSIAIKNLANFLKIQKNQNT